MSLSDWASPIDFTPATNNIKRNKTIKNIPTRKIDKEKITKLLNNTNKKYDDDSDSESDMADFTPPPKPLLTKDSNIDSRDNDYNSTPPVPMQTSPISTENVKQQIPHPFTPYNDNEELLVKKLNYMIKLLEEQKDEKTETITEEVILYCFLGIFVIFVIDSFVKVGRAKYVR